MIYLNPEVKSGLGEDTFWTWFNREIPSTFFNNNIITNKDVVLHYSTLGNAPKYEQTICLLWELYPEMKAVLNQNSWDNKIQQIEKAKNSSKYKVVASKLMIPYYGSDIDVLPIGVDCNLFKPLNNKEELKLKYKIPLNRQIGIWGGTQDKMKGCDKFISFKNKHPEIFWVVIWKTRGSIAKDFDRKNCEEFIKVSQNTLNELFNCGDFFLSTSRLRPFYMIEWEAMASNLPIIILDDIEKDFVPSNTPRDQVLNLGWDREAAKKSWLKYINKVIYETTTL